MYCLFVKVRENRRVDEEWTIQRHGQLWAQDTDRKQNKNKSKEI